MSEWPNDFAESVALPMRSTSFVPKAIAHGTRIPPPPCTLTSTEPSAVAVPNGADAVSSIFRGTILQTVVPDALRGRLNAINIMFVLGGPQLGQFESGAVAALWSPVGSVVSGGVACVASVLAIAAWIPEIVRFRSHHDEAAAAD